jgi:hypothetical protein
MSRVRTTTKSINQVHYMKTVGPTTINGPGRSYEHRILAHQQFFSYISALSNSKGEGF